MRTKRLSIPIIAATALLAISFLTSCAATVEPTITQFPTAELKSDAPIYVIANRQRPRVVRALREAGLNVTNRVTNDSYSLRVLIGRPRITQSCGPKTNIVYILNAFGQRLFVLKSRGYSGDCEPNMLDDMSRVLAQQFRE